MTLYNLLSTIDSLDDEDVIYAEKPFTESSRAISARLPDGGGLPETASEQGLHYFLEVFVAQEVLEGMQSNVDRILTTDERVKTLIYYAINDAWPDL